MKRTILSSFLFLYPTHLAYQRRDTAVMYLSIIGMSLSLINHSHSYHPDNVWRKLFGWLDSIYMSCVPFYLITISYHSSMHSLLYITALMAWFVYVLDGRKGNYRQSESYSPVQRWCHVIFHVCGIIGGGELYRLYGARVT